MNPYIPKCWNLEIFDSSISGEIKSRSFYHLNISQKEVKGEYKGTFHDGDCPSNITDPMNHGESLYEFDIIMTEGQIGTLTLTYPDTHILTEFKFVDTYDDYLGAYGMFNETLTYSANLVNLATLHVSLFSFDKKINREAIFTVMPVQVGEPWYKKYVNYGFIAFVFVVTLIGLKCSAQILKLFGVGNDEPKKKEE